MFHFIYFFSTNISTGYFKHAAHSPFFSSKCRLFHNATFFFPVLFTFYIESVLIFLFIFEIFTLCFKQAISKLFERLHFEGRCYPVIVLPRVEHFLIIIVFYFNTSVIALYKSTLFSIVSLDFLSISQFICLA